MNALRLRLWLRLRPLTARFFCGKTLQTVNGLSDYEIRRARPENGPTSLLATIAGSRVPAWQELHPVLSPNNKWLALTLNDKFGALAAVRR
jgi:hypothetical protein